MLPLERMSLELTLEDGQAHVRAAALRLWPTASSTPSSTSTARATLLDGSFDLSLQQLKLNQLLSRFDIEVADIELEQEGVGTFGGARASSRRAADSIARARGERPTASSRSSWAAARSMR